ncbi:hypothetical protein SpCBS45565_g01387 [Spizellomyces sp. 'palustris']|nr:hypothetical protein SpCBS45565_g01387 [Spizellomyces sp. 'palustris']
MKLYPFMRAALQQERIKYQFWMIFVRGESGWEWGFERERERGDLSEREKEIKKQRQQQQQPPPPPTPLPSNPSGSSQQHYPSIQQGLQGQQQQQQQQQQQKQQPSHHSYATPPAPALHHPQDPFHHHLHHLVHPPPQSLSPSTPNPKNINNNITLPPSVSIPPPVHHGHLSSETYQEKYIRALEERLVAAREISERDFIIRERDAFIRERDAELRRLERDVVAPLQDENKRLIDLNRRLEERIAQLEKSADQHSLDIHRPLIPTSQPTTAVGMAMDPPHSGAYVPAMQHQLPPVDLVVVPKPVSAASEVPDNRPSRTPDPEPEDMDPLNASPGVAWTSVLRKLFPGSLSQLRPAQRTQIESAVKDYLVSKLGPERAAESKVRGLGRSTSLVDAIPSELHADFADWFGQQIESGLLSSSSSSSGGKRKRSSLGATAPWTITAAATATSPVSSTDADSKRAKTMVTPTSSSGPVILGPRYPRDLMAWTDLVRTRYPSFNANVPQMSIFTKSFLKSRGIPDQRYPALNTNKMAWAIPQRYWDEYLEKFEENFPYMAYMRKEKQQQAEAGQRDDSDKVHVPSKRMLKPPPPRDSDRSLDKRADKRNEMAPQPSPQQPPQQPQQPHPDPLQAAEDNGDGFSGGPAERVMQRHTHSASASPLGSPLLSRANSASGTTASGPTASAHAPTTNSPVNVLAYTSSTGPRTAPLTVWTELIRKRYPAYLEAASKPLWNRIRSGVRVFLETVMPAFGVTVDACLASVGKGRKTFGVPDIVEEAFWKWFEEKMKTDFDSFPSSSSRITSPVPHLEARHHHHDANPDTHDDDGGDDNIDNEKSPHPSGVRKITLKNNAPPPPPAAPPSRGPRNGDITLLPNIPSHASSSSSSLAIPASPNSPTSLPPPHPHAPTHHHHHPNHPNHHYQHPHHHHSHRPTTTHIRHPSWEAKEESPKTTNPFTQDTPDNDQDDDDDEDDDNDDEASPSDSDDNDADDEATRRTTQPPDPTSTTEYDPKPIRYNHMLKSIMPTYTTLPKPTRIEIKHHVRTFLINNVSQHRLNECMLFTTHGDSYTFAIPRWLATKFRGWAAKLLALKFGSEVLDQHWTTDMQGIDTHHDTDTLPDSILESRDADPSDPDPEETSPVSSPSRTSIPEQDIVLQVQAISDGEDQVEKDVDEDE